MKKCIALVLALVLMIGILPCVAFAEDAPEKGILAVFSSPGGILITSTWARAGGRKVPHPLGDFLQHDHRPGRRAPAGG